MSKGEFDDILGKDIQEDTDNKKLNKRLIEMYEKIVEKDLKKYQDHWKKQEKNTK